MRSSPTFVLCNSRSRTTWLAHFLEAGHEVSAFCWSLADYWEYEVIVDTNLVNYYGELKARFPQSRFFLMYRELADIKASMENHPLLRRVGDAGVEKTDQALTSLRGQLPEIFFDQLDDFHYLKYLYASVRGKDCPDWRVREFLRSRIETKVDVFFKELGLDLA